jgi:hypothetical protein
MTASRWITLLALLSAIEGANAAPVEHKVNAAEVGTSFPRSINWNTEAAQSAVWCQNACSYSEVSTAKIAPDTLLTYNTTGWPSFALGIPFPATVSRLVLTPAGTTDNSGHEIVYESPSWERASVDNGHGTFSLNTRVYQTGNQGTSGTGTAAAALAYHVKAQNQSSTSRDFFVRFVAPAPTGGVSVPTYIGGPSGQQPFNVSQKKYAKSRSAVDVLVNGLPVWWTSSSWIIPDETTSSSDYTGYGLDYGSAAANDSYTVFVGRFASGEIFDLDFIVRAESLARAPTCHKEVESSLYPNPRALMHCLLITESRTLPVSTGQTERFEIYSKDVSQGVIETLPGGTPIPLAPAPVSAGLNSTKDQ